MRRRHLLSALPTLFAGCTVRGTQFGNNVTNDDAENGCPGFDDHAGELVCAGTEGEGIAFDASAETLSLGDDESIVFELTNRSEQSFSCNPYDWTLFRRSGPVWRRVAPDAVPEPLAFLGPDDSLRWRLRDTNDDASRNHDETVSSNDTESSGANETEGDETEAREDDESAYRASADLEPGTYAFSFSGSLGPSPFARDESSNVTGTTTDTPETKVECVATFVVE